MLWLPLVNINWSVMLTHANHLIKTNLIQGYIFLSHTGGISISKLKNHTKPVLCLSVDDRFIISGSEDQTLSVYDRRAAQVYKTVKVKGLATDN